MVAGGIGHTPFLALAKQYLAQQSYGVGAAESELSLGKLADRVTLCYGAKTADLLSGVNDFEAVGVEVRLATDDGTAGHEGLVTKVLEKCLQEKSNSVCVVCCGPEPMMEAVSEITIARNIPCEVSLETPMACGIGICFTCVAKIRQDDGQWDYKRTCVDGPVFAANEIEW